MFTNIFTSDGYKRLFLSILKSQKIWLKFQHIHKEGIGCILGDLDIAQAKGLGMALHNLDTEKDPETHLIHIFKSCLIHFERQLE